MVTGMRKMTNREAEILDRILEQLPSDREVLREQAARAKVHVIDQEGSLRFLVADTARPAEHIAERVPVTAISDDADGMPVYILLHLIAGRLWELEVYKADGSPIIDPPAPDKLYF